MASPLLAHTQMSLLALLGVCVCVVCGVSVFVSMSVSVSVFVSAV